MPLVLVAASFFWAIVSGLSAVGRFPRTLAPPSPLVPDDLSGRRNRLTSIAASSSSARAFHMASLLDAAVAAVASASVVPAVPVPVPAEGVEEENEAASPLTCGNTISGFTLQTTREGARQSQ